MIPVYQNRELKTIDEVIKEVEKERNLMKVIDNIPKYVLKNKSAAAIEMSKLCEKYGSKNVMEIYSIMLKSNIKKALICAPLTSALSIPLNCPRYHDFTIPIDQVKVMKACETNVAPTIMNDDFNITRRNILNAPIWFPPQVHYIVYAAMCGSGNSFKYAYLNLSDKSVMNSDELDYGALYGGNMEIIHIIEHEGHTFRHFEGAVIGHQNDVLEWCIDTFGYQIPFFEEAMASRNYHAIFLSNFDWFMIADNYCISDIIAGYILCLAQKQSKYIKNSLHTKCSTECVNALLSAKCPRKELYEIFREDIPSRDLNKIYEFLKNKEPKDGANRFALEQLLANVN